MEELYPFRWEDDGGKGTAGTLSGSAFNCVVVSEKKPLPPGSVTGIREMTPEELPGSMVKGAVWPHIRGMNEGGGMSAGPTGEPWIESNGWRIRTARMAAQQEPLWLDYTMPATARAQMYQLAIAEAAARGARWIVSPSEEYRARLIQRESAALKEWDAIAAAGKFFRERSYSGFEPVSRFGIVSEFTGADRFISTETVNMTQRRHMTSRLLKPGALGDLSGFRSILYVDRKPVPDKLKEFAQEGGLLILPAQAPPLSGTSKSSEQVPRFDMRTLGNGRVATGLKPWTDPFVLAADVQILCSRASEVLLVWNAGSVLADYSASPGGKTGLVQLLNYAGRGFGHPVSVRVARKYSRAAIRTLDAPEARSVEVTPAGEGVEIPLPVFHVYAAIELS